MTNSRTNLRFIFWGTPEFAAASLLALLDAGFEPYAVVTSTDKVSGRGMKLNASPVKALALLHNIPVWQPASLKDPLFIQELKESNPDFMLVVAFRMLPKEIIEVPPGGTWNLHASILPDLRGAAPIHWALRLGYRQTGLTVFKIQYEIDTGDVLDSVKFDIPKDWNAGNLHDRMAVEGGKLLVKAVPKIFDGNYQLRPQDQFNLDQNALNKAPKIQRADALIDWSKDSQSLVNFIRAFAPNPGAYTFLNGTRIVLIDATEDEPLWESILPKENVNEISSDKILAQTVVPGYCLTLGDKWWVKTQSSWLRIQQIKPENSRSMPVDAYLRGHSDVMGKICSREL